MRRLVLALINKLIKLINRSTSSNLYGKRLAVEPMFAKVKWGCGFRPYPHFVDGICWWDRWDRLGIKFCL